MNNIREQCVSKRESTTYGKNLRINEVKDTINLKVLQTLWKKSGIVLNRISLISYFSMFIAVPTMIKTSVHAFILSEELGHITSNQTQISDIFIFFAAYMISQASLCNIIITKDGRSTRKNYMETLKILQDYKDISPKRFLEMMWQEEEKKLIGYCELQWIYLGMKEYGLEKQFLEYKEKYTNNIVPNF